MSLVIDKFFYSALFSSERLYELTHSRIYNTARPEKDETEDVVPYIILTYEGMTNASDHKDTLWEGDEDTETVGVLCVAETREALAELTTEVRRIVKEYAEDGDDELCPNDYTISASAVQYDAAKPCVYQTLTYVCLTDNI